MNREFLPEEDTVEHGALTERLFVVHATDSFLTDYLIADLDPQNITRTPFKRDEVPFFRPTVHFSIGGLCVPHSNQMANWDNKRYAMVMPLDSLLQTEQVVNLSVHDTFAVGNIALSSEVTLLMPDDEPECIGTVNPRIKRYPRDKQSLREAINDVISEQGGVLIDRPEGSIEATDPAYINDLNVNTPDYFKAILDSHPDISFGSHSTSLEGNAQLFGLIDSHCVLLKRPDAPINHLFSRIMTEYHLAQLVEQSQSYHPRARDAVFKAVAELHGKLGKWDDLDVTNLTDADAARIDTLQWGNALGPLGPDEVTSIISKNPDLFKYVDMPKLQVQYALRRWLSFGSERAHTEGLTDILAEHLNHLDQGKENRPLGALEPLNLVLNVRKGSCDAALDILDNPSIRAYCKTVLEWKIPAGRDNLTVETIIKTNPRTRVLFENRPGIKAENPDGYAILNGLGLYIDDETVLEYAPAATLDNFHAMSQRATLLQFKDSLITDYLATIQTPLHNRRNFDDLVAGDVMSAYEQLSRRDAAEMWQTLGLEKQYRLAFASSEAFWSSDQSLLELYCRFKDQQAQDEPRNRSEILQN